MAIPKKIHYCWLGGAEKSKSIIKCIASWKKYCPDYEIIEWNETNLDIGSNLYSKQAYDAKAWGFVPDYFRLWIIYNYGGIYLDTDVQLIRSLDDLLDNKCYAGFEAGVPEYGLYVALGLGFGAEAGNEFIKEHMKVYDNLRFINPDGSFNKVASPKYTTDLLMEKNLDRHTDSVQKLGDITIYSSDYFCPKSFQTGLVSTTHNTYSIHLFDASWFDEDKQKEKLRKWKKSKKDYLIHFPNRLGRKLLGDKRYEALKAKLKGN